MTIVETLRSRRRPVPQAKKAALEKAETLTARGVAEALRRDLGKAVVPELQPFRQTATNAARHRAGNLGVCLRHLHSC